MSDVLERNVRALLRRSYVPALPAPHYRDRLESLFLGEVETRWRRPRRFARRPAVLLVGLAAACLALFLGWRAFLQPEPATREGLLARGEVALRFTDEAWRAASAEERMRGVAFVAPRLAVATPRDASFDVRVPAGVLHLAKETEVEVERREEHDFARLLHGSAWFERGTERLALAAGAELELARAPELAAAAGGALAPAPRREAQPSIEPKPTPSAPTARAWTGRVVAREGGAPVGEFTIGLLAERRGNQTPPPLCRTFTSTDGSFRWLDPPSGKQRPFVHAPGFALAALGERDFSLELPVVEVELDAGASVRGIVLDDEENPVADALVISEADAPADGLFFHGAEHAFWLPVQARTGADGRFELAHLNPGQHILRASAAGRAPAWLEKVAVPAAPGDELVLRLGPGGTVTGRVTRADGGPWADAKLVVVAMEQVARPLMSFAFTTTDAEGTYTVEHVPPATMIVVLLRDDRPDVKPVEVHERLVVRADFLAPKSGLRLVGRVLDAAGKPVRQQNLGLFDRDQATWSQNWVASTTRDDGGFTFEGVEPGSYLLYLIDDLGQHLRCVDEVVVAKDAGVEVQHDVRLPSGTLAVEVRAAATGAPVPDATLFLMGVDSGRPDLFTALGKSDAQGQFLFTDVRPGTYSLTAYPATPELGFARGERVVLGEDGHERTRVELEEGGCVDVFVHDATGRALAGATLLFVDEQGEEHAFARLPYAEDESRYRVYGLRPGTYRVRALLAGYQGTPVPFRFELGRTPEVSVVVAPVPAR